VAAERTAAREDLVRIGRLVGCDSLVGVEIHAAVEHVVRFELEAARDAAERAERERDDALAIIETRNAENDLLREKLAAHARHTDAGVDGVRATATKTCIACPHTIQWSGDVDDHAAAQEEVDDLAEEEGWRDGVCPLCLIRALDGEIDDLREQLEKIRTGCSP
jgi:hypothetical protein